MILKSTEIANALSDKFTMSLSDVQRVKQAYASIDIEKLKSDAAKRIRVVPWEKGQKAPTGKLWEEIHPELLDGAKAYSVFIDDALVYFQYEAPYGKGKMMTDKELQAAQAEHVANIIDEMVNAQLTDLVLEKLE